MATITALTAQKRKKQRVNVFLDGEFAFSLPDVDAAALQVGQELDDEAVQRLRWQSAFSLAMQRAMRFLAYRPRSCYEVAHSLHLHNVDEALIKAVLARLEELHYLDDQEFARFWVENRQRFRPKGIIALRYELRQKGIAEEIIATVLAQISPEEEAYRAAAKMVSRWRMLSQREFKRKLYAFLNQRGFRYDEIKSVTNRLLEEGVLTADEDER